MAQETTAETQKASKSKGASVMQSSASERKSMGWKAALIWAGFITCWYLTLQQIVRDLVKDSAEARAALLRIVPLHVYRYSEAAFAVATVLNLLNCLFEETPDKQQLGLLSAVIKGLSWHSDYLIVSGKAVIKFDFHGAIFVPSRYAQWSCSTPTMIFTLSRISSMDAPAIAKTMAMDWLMVVSGYLASELPWWAAVWPLALSFLCMFYVLTQLRSMLGDAMKEAGSKHARACLQFTFMSTIAIWSMFPTAWLLSHALAYPAVAAWGEPMTMFANFAAKVIFSTSIMYNNFVTLAERRRAARLAAEHAERIQAVHDLSVAVGRKDAFLEIVGHELRAPLNAICQLSAALGVGAGGPLTPQAREWMDTIKASAGHLLGVVNDILTFRAGQVAGLAITQELVFVADVVDEVLRTLLPTAGTGLLLEKVLHARLPPVVADRRRLVLAITNLVANSIKFMDKPTGKVTVKAYPDRGARHVIIKVIDNGPGLTAKQLAQLGDIASLAQVDSGKRRAGGLGLGLPITFQLVAAHGGVLRMSSPGTGQGTTALIRLPVLQATTDIALQKDFVAAYTALGYNMEQLLSPELAAAEGRACPVFTEMAPPLAAQTSAPLTSSGSNTQAGVTSVTPTVAASPGRRPSDVTRPTTYVATAPGLATTAMPAGHALPAVQRVLNSSASIASTNSSFDMSAANVHTYQWYGGDAAAGGGQYDGMGGGSATAGGGGHLDDPFMHTHNPMRPSEDSLAAWEAYAESMGYTLQSSQRAPSQDASPPMSMVSNILQPMPQITSAAAAAKGMPGQAVALMSSLYVNPAAASAAAAAAAMRRQKSKRDSRPNRTSQSSSTRMSIEEGDEEGQEEEEEEVRTSVEEVGTPKRQSTATYVRHSEDLPSQQSMSHVQLLNAAAAAMASQIPTGSVTPMTLADSAPVSGSLPLVAAKSGGSGPILVDAPEWDDYLRTGGDSAGSNCRMESESVVAANARLSMQYQKAVAEAQASGKLVDSAWQSWVARIPEHHKAPAPGAAGGAATPAPTEGPSDTQPPAAGAPGSASG